MKTTTYTKSSGTAPRRRRARSQAGERVATRRPSTLLSQSPNAIRLRRLRAKAVKNGKCKVCRFRYPKPGQKICAHCYALKNERAAGYVAKGLCSCGRTPERGKLRCTSCREVVERSRAKRQEHLAAIGRCTTCGHGWPKSPNKICPSCIVNTNAYGTLRRAVNQAAGLCACGRKRSKGLKTCARCRVKRAISSIKTRQTKAKESRP